MIVRWRVALCAAVLSLPGCDDGEVSPTPTVAPPGGLPGEGRLVGGVGVGSFQGYDLASGQLGDPDTETTGIGAAFLDPQAAGEVDPAALGLPFSLPEEGLAVETCAYTAPAEPTPAPRAVPAEDEALSLVSVGDVVTVKVGAASVEVPLLTEEDLPPPLEGQPLPPAYLISAEGFQEEWYDPAAAYGISAEGSDRFGAFVAAAFFTPPQRLVVTAPDLGAVPTLSVGAAVEVRWEAGASTWVGIDLRGADGAGLTCLATDDGAFTVPAEQVALLAAGPGVLTVARAELAWTEIRLNEWILGAGVSGVAGLVELAPARR